MIDLHSGYDSAGSTTLVNNATIPSGDGATTMGVSPFANAILIGFGAITLAADAVKQIALQSNNQIDPVNKFSYAPTGTSTKLGTSFYTQLSYARGPNLVQYAQKAAGAIITHTMDHVTVGSTWAPPAGTFAIPNSQTYTTTAGGAATAGVYQTTAFAPATTPPVGTYAILGAYVDALTGLTNLRFQHTDFGGAFPGFPVADFVTGTNTIANLVGSGDILDSNWAGYQFVRLSQILNTPECPMFRIQGQGTGLNFQICDTSADTASIILNVVKVA